MVVARKISFQEAWESATVFFVDNELEDEIDMEVESLLDLAKNQSISEDAPIEVDTIANFLSKDRRAIEVVLKDIELSEEKFMRIISLLRRLGRIPGKFESEWGFAKIKQKIMHQKDFALLIATLLVDGKRDTELFPYIPRYYLETLNYREIKGSSLEARRIRYKRSLIGTYGGKKGYKVEDKIRQELDRIQNKYRIHYAQGRSRMVETDMDFAIPTVEDPWIIIMSSFQETTSSGQTTKARDMLSAYERVQRSNNRYGENRVFINFVDGGGWLARKRDLERLVENCHYFINIYHLDMLEDIILKHIPEKYRNH